MSWSDNRDKNLSRISADQSAASRFGQMQAERRKAIKEGRVRGRHQVWVRLAPQGNHLHVDSDYAFKDVSRALPDARWDDLRRTWKVPATQTHLDAIHSAFSDQKYSNRFNPGRDKPVEVRVFPEVHEKLAQQINKTDPIPVRTVDRVKTETDWVCPHCNEIIREKSLYSDRTNWFHRPCIDRGPILLPK